MDSSQFEIRLIQTIEMNTAPKLLQVRLRTILLLFIPVALVLIFGVDRYRHARECQNAFAKLEKMGLSHEFESAASAGDQVFFYSTRSGFDSSDTSQILRHLKSLSREYNSSLRFAYDIQTIDFRNSEPNSKLIEELRATFPDLEVRHRDSDEG